jgi:hypothetical protein
MSWNRCTRREAISDRHFGPRCTSRGCFGPVDAISRTASVNVSPVSSTVAQAWRSVRLSLRLSANAKLLLSIKAPYELVTSNLFAGAA